MEQRKIIFALILSLLFIPLVMAETTNTFKQNELVDLKIFCFNETSGLCLPTTECQITVLRPNFTPIVTNESMSLTSTYFNYTLQTNETITIGEHSAMVTCQGTEDGYTSFNFFITSTGYERAGGDMIGIMIMLGIILVAVLCAAAAKYFDNELKFFFMLASILSVVFGLNMLATLAEAAGSTSTIVGLLWFIYQIGLYFFWFIFLYILVRMLIMIFSTVKTQKIKSPKFMTPMQKAKTERKERRGY